MNEIFARPLPWIGRRRNGTDGGTSGGGHFLALPQEGGLLVEELQTYPQLLSRRRPAQHLLETRLHKYGIIDRVDPRGQRTRQQARLRQGQRAISQGQGLLRHDALTATVTLVDAGRVEQRQKL